MKYIILLMLASCTCAPLNSANGIVNRTIDPDNVIMTYEYFLEAYTSIEARVADIKQAHELYDAAPTDESRMELNALRQSCRALVSDYNANASKANRNIFMSESLPSHIELEVCE